MVDPMLKHYVMCFLSTDLISCSECPSDKPDLCNCGVCGSYGGCSFSCDINSATARNKGFTNCVPGKNWKREAMFFQILRIPPCYNDYKISIFAIWILQESQLHQLQEPQQLQPQEQLRLVQHQRPQQQVWQQ